MRRLGFSYRFGYSLSALMWGLWLLTSGNQSVGATTLTASQIEVMHAALHQALALQFEQALATAANLEADQKPTLASQLTRGMIAYFQTRWQIRQQPPARQAGHQSLSKLLDEGQTQLKRSPQDRWLLLILGTAAMVDAVLQQDETPWQSLTRFKQGQIWLQQALVQHEDTADAHLGLGLLYFADSALPNPISRLLQVPMERTGASMTVHHLQRAAEMGRFSREVAQTFLLRVYELEHRYDDAIELGKQLQSIFPQNGYYALRTGGAQCALSHYTDCATTLSALADRYTHAPESLAHRADRFDLFYTWATALTELGLHDSAFHAYRKAINQDPHMAKDETLWAKFYVARHYERRQQYQTARQFYQTLLRGRQVDDLRQRVMRRLQSLPSAAGR
jgi:tetratricopeptide (TPR) repeat protein